MSDEFLNYYQQEQLYFHQISEEYIKKHPQFGARFGMTNNAVTDPNMGKLIKSYALLNARLRCRIEDDFPEIAASLLTNLHPHYVSPMPAIGIAQFIPNMNELDKKIILPKGLKVVLTGNDVETDQNTICMTCYETVIYPFFIDNAKFSGYPCENLSLTIRCSQQVSLKDILPNKLRFFIHAKNKNAYLMYEWFMYYLSAIDLAISEKNNAVVSIPCSQLTAIGLGSDQSLFHYPLETPERYQLLTDFFHYPQKFLFFDIEGLEEPLQHLHGLKNQFTVVFSFSKSNKILEKNIVTDNFQLGCTPIFYPYTESPSDFLSDCHIQKKLYLEKEDKNVDKINLISPMNFCKIPQKIQCLSWKQLAHLKPNYLSISNDDHGAISFREMLGLYISEKCEETDCIAGILEISHKTVVCEKPCSAVKKIGNIFCEGIEISLKVDEEKFKNTNLFLFGSIIERFFAGYATKKSFTKLVILNKHDHILYEWQPRAGELELI